MEDKFIFNEIKSSKPGIWFKFNVLSGGNIVAEFETQIDKGYCLEGKREPVYTIYKMIVNYSYRRKGLGTQIIKYCEQLASQKKLNKLVVLIHPLDENITFQNLKSFYTKNGMRIIVDKMYNKTYAVKNLVF